MPLSKAFISLNMLVPIPPHLLKAVTPVILYLYHYIIKFSIDSIFPRAHNYDLVSTQYIPLLNKFPSNEHPVFLFLFTVKLLKITTQSSNLQFILFHSLKLTPVRFLPQQIHCAALVQVISYFPIAKANSQF